jgi:predicted acetyltransferase
MKYRAITKEEKLQLEDLQAHCFFYTYDKKKFAEELEKDDNNWRTGRGAFDDNGKLLAGLELLPFEVWFDGTSVGMGGIGGVVSRVEDRRGGNIRKLFELVFQEMYDRGDVFSYLYPFSHPYYRKFGYEVSLTSRIIKAPLQPLLCFAQPGQAEQFLPGDQGNDPTPIVEIYNAFASQHNLALDRAGWRWERILEHDPAKERYYTYIWRNEEGAPTAYSIIDVAQNGNATEIRVKEAAWLDKEALKGLLGFLGRFGGNIKKLEWAIPGSFAPELFWEEPWELETEYKYNGMNRIINVAEALKLMRKPHGQGSVRIAVTDSFFPKNTGTYKIDWENGSGSVKKSKSATADMECSVQALAQMVVGYLPFGQITQRPDVTVHGKAAEFDDLFPTKALYLPDHF